MSRALVWRSAISRQSFFLGLFLLGLAGLVALAGPARASEMDFASWLMGLRREAAEQGIREGTIDRALDGVTPLPRVLELDRRQPERNLSLPEYLAGIVSPARVKTGRQQLRQNRSLLSEIGRAYGVQPRFIVALWGIESEYGRGMGGFPVIGALATLAYDGRRSAFFRGELIDALKILDHGDIAPEAMRGSWAGAMGQSQFMPSSYLRYAVDWRHDGHRDIWSRREDVFASIANYLATVGWHKDQGWGRKVRLPPGFDSQLVGTNTRKSLDEWRSLGLRNADGKPLPAGKLSASVVIPGKGEGKDAFLVYDNYWTLLDWNNSLLFATAVGYLADAIDRR